MTEMNEMRVKFPCGLQISEKTTLTVKKGVMHTIKDEGCPLHGKKCSSDYIDDDDDPVDPEDDEDEPEEPEEDEEPEIE